MQKLQIAYLGMQCFWGSESAFALLPGVQRTRVGYSGGTSSSPTYQNIGDHTEVVEIQFNKELTNYEEIIKLFYSLHNITQSHKTQYKSLILYIDEEQKNIAIEELKKAKEEYDKKSIFYTFLQKFEKFYQAEDYHQKYWLRCENNILKEIKINNSELIKSTLATKINAFLGGTSKDFDLLYSIQKQYNLSDSLIKAVKNIASTGGIGNCH